MFSFSSKTRTKSIELLQFHFSSKIMMMNFLMFRWKNRRRKCTWVRSWWISWWRVNVWEKISDPPDDTHACIWEITCCRCLSSCSILDPRLLLSFPSSTFVDTSLRYKCIWSSNSASRFLAYRKEVNVIHHKQLNSRQAKRCRKFFSSSFRMCGVFCNG